MAEKKILQLTIDEREAEMIAGALTIALAVTCESKPGAALNEDGVSAVLMLTDAAKLGCAVAQFYGLPCQEHHERRVMRTEVSKGKKDAVDRAIRVAEICQDFSEPYRTEKIEAFPVRESDWVPPVQH